VETEENPKTEDDLDQPDGYGDEEEEEEDNSSSSSTASSAEEEEDLDNGLTDPEEEELWEGL
jgi:hypothetical protein